MKVFGNRIMVLLITAFVLARAFDCSYIQDQDSCLSLDGCTWPTDKCKGSFLSNCQVPDCYYVDPLNGLDSQNGNVSTPFNSLTSAFRKLGILSGNIILLNYRPQAETDILDYTTINSNITVKPLFPNNKYTISLANFNISSLPTNEKSALTVNSGMLTLIGCTINDRTSREGLGSIFEVGNANLIFKNVNIVDYQGTIPLVMIAADKATASFNYLGGNHQNSSFWFSLLAGIHIMKDLQIENNKAPDQLIYVGNKLNISNVTVSKGASLLLKLMEQTSVNVSNVIVSNYTNGFINGVNPGSVNISLSKFQDLDLGTSSLITLQIFVNPNNPVRTPFWTNHTIFQNVNVTKSVLSVNLEDDFVLLYNYAYYMFNVTMTNITKKVPVNNTPSASDDIGGVCFWGQRIALNFNASTFINVSSHCIFTEDARVVATSNVFDNSKLKATLLAPGDIISDSQGVSWISLSCFISTTPLQVVSTITGNSFIENKILTRYGGAIRLIGECYYVAQIINNIFTGNTAVDGGAIYSGSPFSLLILMNNVYTNNSAMNGGAICKVTPAYRLPFVDTTTTTAILAGENFTSNTASYKGGAIYLEWESLILANSLFNNSRAQYGGALYFASLNVVPTSFNKLNNNTFESNTATISGSAMKLLFDFSKTDSILSKTRTYSYYCAGTPNCQFTIPVIPIPSNFTNNVDPKNQNISDSKPTSFNFSFYDILLPELTIAGNEDFNLWIGNTTRTRLSDTWNNLNFSQDFTINQKSGHNLSQIILVEVIDQYGLPVDFIFNESVSASITANQNHVNDFKASLANSIETFSFNRGRLFMKSVVIVGHPNTTATLTIQTLDDTLSILKDANLDLSQNIQIYFQPCELGDMYQPITHTCYTCPEGSYTLLEPNSSLECIPCDNKRAICPGGSRIAPKPGFWRYSNTSDNIVECENEEACLGGLINNAYSPQGECAFPYQGNLCNECAYGYAKFGNASSCVDCTINFGYYVKMAGFLLIQIVIVLYAVKSNVDRISEIKRSQTEDSLELKMKIQNETLQSNLLKVGVNFIQSSTVILTLQLEWPDFVDNVIGSTNRIFPTYKDGFSINCVVALVSTFIVKGNNQDLYFIQYIANLIEPFGLWLIIILFYMLYLKITAQPIFGNPKLKQTCFVLFLIIGFLLQPNIIQTSLSLFACRNLNSSEDPIYYMNEDTEVQCWTFRHMVWCLAVAMPNLILWAVVLPLILFIKIRKHKKCLKDLDFESKYSFILQRLKNNRYYWEFVALLRKIALIVTSTLFSFLSKKSQAIAVFFMISIFTFLHLKYRPYMDKQVNRAEFLSLISLSSLAFCGVFFAKGKSEELGRILFTTVACVSNIMFFAYLGLHLTKSYLHTIKKFLHKLLSDEKEKKEEKVEGSVLSANPLPCQSVDEVEDKSSSPADQQKENIISL